MKFASDFIRVHRNRWEIQPSALRPDEVRELDWSRLLPANAGTKHQRAYLVKSSKEFIAAWISSGRTGQLSGGSVIGIYLRLRRLVQWMVARDLWRFGELTEADMINFLVQLSENKPMAFESVAKYTLLFQKMWKLRTEHIGSLRQDPIFLVKHDRIFGGLRRRSPWKAIDEREALPLIRDALNWMQERVPMLQVIVDQLWKAGLRCIGHSKAQRREILHSAYRDIESTSAYVELADLIGMNNVCSRQVIRRLIALTEGAAANVIFFVVGMRVSEMLSLDVDAVRRQLHSDGHALEYLQGIAAKKHGEARGWVASSFVTDSLNKMCMLFNGPRTYVKRKHVFISFCGTNGYPLPGRRISQTRACTVAKKMRLFANACFRPDAPFKARLHPHAGRKTFANFVVKRDKRSLGALAHHYGHAHRIFTDSHYVGSDIELATMISEENRRDLAAGLTDILRSSNLSGKASGLLKLAAKPGTSKQSLRGRKTIEKLAERLIDEGVTLAPCDWGYCVYAQAFSACGGDAVGPNSVERAPDVCGKCSNFVVTDIHRAWWEERVRDASIFLSRPGVTAQSIAVVERRRDIAEKILRNLNSAHQKVKTYGGK